MQAADTNLEDLYDAHFPALVDFAVHNSVPLDEAEELAHEVLLSSLIHRGRISNLNAWLTGALTSAIRHKEEA
ncbi:MAG TPA: hypothetical protein VEK11_20195 [Thermoanaerobaculia bacterium]|jgi:DNA-directed RNA polymerase specialized sigma24 family protein|nr:hypothetical protein [Thermoanaerobaculia bacterium]